MSSAIRTHPARLFLITDKQHSARPRVVLRLISAPRGKEGRARLTKREEGHQ
jgi:hypothetical protein